jgi:hypothetical protein
MSNGTDAGDGGLGLWLLCAGNPHLKVCEDVPSYYGYRLSLPANATFLAFFGVFLIAYIVIYAATRRGLGFTVAMTLGIICEILGYAGRVMSWENQWTENGFLMQICCLTIAPAFMAAGIYLCLRRIVYTFGPENSRIPPEFYTRIVSLPPLPLTPLPPSDGPTSPTMHNRVVIPSLTRNLPNLSSSPATSSPSFSRQSAAPWPR